MATKRRPRKAPAVADPEALAKAKAAAEAVGLDVGELANLLVDNGLTTLPETDGITEVYTLENLGVKLWGEMNAIPRTERAAWFANLAEPQRIAIIVTLRDRGFATMTMSRELDMPALEINKIWNRHCDDLGAQVVGLRLNTIAGAMQIAAERAQEIAAGNRDAAAFWRIEKDKVGVMQSLGIIDKAIHRVEHTHKFDDQRKTEIDAMLELERKKAARTEEIRQIEAEVVDEVPDDLLEDYD